MTVSSPAAAAHAAAGARGLKGRLLYVVVDRIEGRAVIPALEAMLERQGWDAARLRAETDLRVRRQLEHAIARVPFYQRLGLATSATLDALPLIGREELRRHGDSLRVPDVPPGALEEATSGGSTGTPVRVWLDAPARDAQMAGVLRAQTWMGLPLVTRHALLWGPPPDVVTYGTLKGRLRGLPIRRSFYPTYGLDDAAAARLRDQLRHGAFPQVFGYSSALDRIASGAEPLPRPARAVVASAEILFPAQRRRIERFFGAPLFERYGCNEFAAIAHQCARGGRHVLSDRVVLEILDRSGRPAPPGTIGEAVVSDLDNRAMPLLRYRLGDAIEAGGTCSCPLPFPVVGPVHGRMADLLEGEGGRMVSPRHVAETLAPCGEALEHQVRVADGGLTCLVRSMGSFDFVRAASALGALFGLDVAVRPAVAIERWPSGKVRPVVREAAA